MGLTCRLLGHSYGEPETEREREERGDEVVVSIRELQVCSRCGHEQVISENKEVTAIRTPEEVGMTEGEAETAAAGFEPANPKPGTSDTADQSAEAEPNNDVGGAPDIETAPDPETEAEIEADSTPEHPTAGEVDEESEPEVTDDAIILDDDDDDDLQRDRTQWPDEMDDVDTDDSPPKPTADADDAEFIDADANASTDAGNASTQSRDHGAWPDTPGEDEGFDAQPNDGEPVSVSFGGGLTPESNGSVSSSSNDEFIEAGESDEFVRADEANIGSETPDESIEYYCPNCGHSRGASSSSMRAGDICPECKKGYIAEREA
ncbi:MULTISPECIES: hypothetical protein [Haloferax]|uniref:Uncharacterized protein n=1 Tax=Haloferax marinum TaxID=2666143 RepID=A0A6A8G6M5_9EURY|nr:MULTISPECIES: hypothetical protein [Haloferax]KAB1197363.1 hypothetical protein Hfx1150_07480 [Haloferax sp. CBA1150]MRW96405.1 hypothetical protein [Haloferax marinum]